MGPSLGGDEGNRTPDPLLAKQVLSQLSYTPIFSGLAGWFFKILRRTCSLRGTFKIEQCNYECFHCVSFESVLESELEF